VNSRTSANIRFDLGDLSDLADSIRSFGVLEPIVVIPDGGGHRIVAGHRRCQAAIAAEQATVPVVVRADLAADPDALAAMIVENTQRTGLSQAEEAAALAQLAAFPEMTAQKVARRTGRKLAEVTEALTLHALPEGTKPHVEGARMTVEQAIEVEGYNDDPKAYARLLKAAGAGYGMHYALADEKRKRQERADKERAKAELTLAGVRIVKRPDSLGYGSREELLTYLAEADGAALTVDAHAGCPGHAACLTNGQATYLCTKPDEYGHTRRRPDQLSHPRGAGAR